MTSPSRWIPAGFAYPGEPPADYPADDLYPGASLFDSTTDYGWEIDGVPLNTYAYNITTSGGDLTAPPTFRGTNRKIPNRAGTRWLPKVPDERTIEFDMWVLGASLAGDYLDRRALETNWGFLRALFWRLDGREFELAKHVLGVDGQMHRVVARASYDSGLSRNMTGPLRAEMNPVVRLADPFFYADKRTDILVPAWTGNTALAQVFGGDVPTDDVRVSWTGLATIVVNVSRPSAEQYQGAAPYTTVSRINSDGFSSMDPTTTYLLDAKERRATKTLAGGVVKLDSGAWTHFSAPAGPDWLLADNQVTTFVLSQAVPSGTSPKEVKLSVRERYL